MLTEISTDFFAIKPGLLFNDLCHHNVDKFFIATTKYSISFMCACDPIRGRLLSSKKPSSDVIMFCQHFFVCSRNCQQAQIERSSSKLAFLMAPKSPICHLSMESSDDNLFCFFSSLHRTVRGFLSNSIVR